MAYSRDDLAAAAHSGIISSMQLDALLSFLESRAPSPAASGAPRAASGPRFDLVHLFWYAGALIVMSAMGLFSTLAFAAMGGPALTATAVIYAVLFGWAGDHLWRKRGLTTPGGLLIAIAVSMAPLAVFGIQDAFGLWTDFGKPAAVRDFYIWIKGSFIFMEIATVAAAIVALRFYRFPFIVLLIGIALWFFSMDVVPWLLRAEPGEWELSRKVSVWFGLAMLIVALVVNLRQRRGDFAFWLYLFGMLTFWGGITASSGGSNFDKALYVALNIALVLVGTVLSRRVFVVFGTIGVAFYLGDLAGKIFKDSVLFPFALSLIGVAIIALGLFVHRHRAALAQWLDARLPPALKRLRMEPPVEAA